MKTVLRLQEFEDRLTPAAAIDSAYEIYGWALVNTLRANPAGFADNLQGLVNGTTNSAFGFSKADPVVTDLKSMISRASAPANYGAALYLMRATPAAGPLAWDDTLEARADAHVAWMKANGFAHTGQAGHRSAIPGFTSNDSAPTDIWGYGPPAYPSWGENIGWAVGFLSATKAAYNAGSLNLSGLEERAAFLDTVGYMLELNSSDLGHLENMLGRDAGSSGTLPTFNVFGANLDLYEAPGQYEAQDGVPEAWVSTERFGLIRPNGTGGFVAGIAYQDLNGNGFFDPNEGAAVTVDIRDAAGRGVTDTLSAGNHGAFSDYLPNGAYTVTASAGGAVLATRTVTIANSNAWANLVIAGLGRPVVTGPTGIQQSVRPTVTWNPVDGATAYQVRVDDTTTATTNLFPTSATTATNWSPPTDLASGHVYVVLVRALRGTVPGPWSSSRTISVSTPATTGPAATAAGLRPTLSLSAVTVARPTPTGPATGVGALRPAFTWTPVPGAIGYAIRVDDVSTGVSGLYAAQVSQPVWVPPADLVSGRTYCWQVQALNADGSGAWTPLTSFAVGKAVPIGPGGSESELKPTFTWAGLAGSTTYQVRVDDLTTGQAKRFFPLVSVNQAWTPPTDLARGHSYRWWVRVVVPGPQGTWYGAWSASKDFRIV